MTSAQYNTQYLKRIEDNIKVLQLLAKISGNPTEKKHFKIQIVNLKAHSIALITYVKSKNLKLQQA
jgi:hypothetical protein